MPSVNENLVSLRPEFVVTGDAAEIKKYLQKFVDRVEEGVKTGKDPGCLNYEFLWNDDLTRFQAREMYSSPELCSVHFDWTADLVPGLLALGVELDNSEVMCNKKATEDAVFMKHMQDFKATVFTKD